MTIVFAIKCDSCGELVMTQKENLDPPESWEEERKVRDGELVSHVHECSDCKGEN